MDETKQKEKNEQSKSITNTTISLGIRIPVALRLHSEVILKQINNQTIVV